MPAFGKAALFGKIPSHGDFVRVRAAEEPARSFVLWLEEGSETARRVAAPAGPEPVRFLFRRPPAARALAGVMAGSADKVGRSFPLAVFAPVEGPDLEGSFPALALAAEPFLDAAAALLAQAGGLAPAELAARLEGLPCPAAADVAAADERARGAAQERAAEILSRALGEVPAAEQAYALHCVRAACRPEPGSGVGSRAVVLACPARCAADRWFWLELARRALRWPGPPSFFWREAGGPPLLLALGSPPPWAFAELWRPEVKDPRVWPLRTTQTAALDLARRNLGPPVMEALERRELSAAGLIDLLAG